MLHVHGRGDFPAGGGAWPSPPQPACWSTCWSVCFAPRTALVAAAGRSSQAPRLLLLQAKKLAEEEEGKSGTLGEQAMRQELASLYSAMSGARGVDPEDLK